MAAAVPAAPALPVGELAALARETALPQEEQNVRQILEWVGFQHAITRERITGESFTMFAEIQTLEESDITNLADSFSKRTPAAQRILFGQRRTKKIKGHHPLGQGLLSLRSPCYY